MLWSRTGTFDFFELFELAQGGGEALAGLGLVTFFIYLGAAGKSAQFPLHVWLPDAMEGPTPVSALIHAATMVTAGVYLLFRTAFLFEHTPDVLGAVGWIGAFTALLAATLACVQSDIKRVLAYSTVSQLGYMMAAIGAGFAERGLPPPADPRGLQGAALPGRGRGHPRGRHQRHLRDGRPRPPHAADLHRVPGRHPLARGHPALRRASSPRRRSWARRWAGGLTVPFGMLVLAAFLTAFYMFRVVFIAFFGAPGARPRVTARRTPTTRPPIMALPLWILAALAVGIGIWFSVSHPASGVRAPGLAHPARGRGGGGRHRARLARLRRCA